MKALHICLFAIILLTLTTSCEKVILIELNEADQKIVVDAIVSNDSVQNYVILSKSGGFYQDNDFEAITGASVTITDDAGVVYSLSESAPGYYSDPNLVGKLKTNYDLGSRCKRPDHYRKSLFAGHDTSRFIILFFKFWRLWRSRMVCVNALV